MREIKFRAWLTKKKAMAEVYTLGLTGIEYSTVSVNKELWSGVGNEDMVLMQYTGLSDNNGKDIYEKDITEEGSYTDWCDKCIGYQQFGMMEEGAFCHNCDGDYSLTDLVSELEVIGNIYENPDLIQ